jgi:hypothetical protein
MLFNVKKAYLLIKSNNFFVNILKLTLKLIIRFQHLNKKHFQFNRNINKQIDFIRIYWQIVNNSRKKQYYKIK